MDYKVVTSCRICGSTDLHSYLNLGETPLANALLDHPDSEYCTYPLELLFCTECSLSQLSIVVDPAILYKDYPYHSSVSETFKTHCREMAKDVKAIIDSNKPWKPIENTKEGTLSGGFHDLTHSVLDIACNDGCLLNEFRNEGFNVMGVEPSTNLANISSSKGITTINDFWNEESSRYIPLCDVVTATNVLAHVDDVKGFISAARRKLSSYKNGIIVIEVPYAYNMITKTQFDTVYHEHLSYFTFKSLQTLFNSCGMRIFRVDQMAIHGGSLRVYASPFYYEEDSSVQDLEHFEESSGILTFPKYLNYSTDVEQIKENLKLLIDWIRENGKRIMGYGASAKGINLINYCGFKPSDILEIVDDTPHKQGKFIPRSSIPIKSMSSFDHYKPDYILILAWNFAEELMRNTEFHKARGGKYIIPIPTVRII